MVNGDDHGHHPPHSFAPRAGWICCSATTACREAAARRRQASQHSPRHWLQRQGCWTGQHRGTEPGPRRHAPPCPTRVQCSCPAQSTPPTLRPQQPAAESAQFQEPAHIVSCPTVSRAHHITTSAAPVHLRRLMAPPGEAATRVMLCKRFNALGQRSHANVITKHNVTPHAHTALAHMCGKCCTCNAASHRCGQSMKQCPECMPQAAHR